MTTALPLFVHFFVSSLGVYPLPPLSPPFPPPSPPPLLLSPLHRRIRRDVHAACGAQRSAADCAKRCLGLDLMLEDAGTDPRILGWVPSLWMTKTLRDCVNPWKFVNGPASAVVVSMMRFGWQVLPGSELGTHNGVRSFASAGHGEWHAVLQDAYDRWTWEYTGDQTPPGSGTGWRPDSHVHHSSLLCSTCARREDTWHGARCSLCSWARCARRIWSGLERFAVDRSFQLALSSAGGLAVAQMLQVRRI